MRQGSFGGLTISLPEHTLGRNQGPLDRNTVREDWQVARSGVRFVSVSVLQHRSDGGIHHDD